MQTLSFVHQAEKTTKEGGKSMHVEESFIVGPKGASIKFFKKDDTSLTKIYAKEEDGKYTLLTIKDEERVVKEDLSKAAVMKLLAGVKGMEFVAKYATKAFKK